MYIPATRFTLINYYKGRNLRRKEGGNEIEDEEI
jgi:hypothetical protein